MGDPHESLWSRAPAWRWLLSLALLGTVLLVLARPWRSDGSATIDPLAHYDTRTGPVGTRTANAPSPPPVVARTAQDPEFPLAPAGAISASGSTVPPVQSGVVWAPGSGTITGAGLTAAYCCAGASSTVYASKAVNRGRHYWELTLSVGPGSTRPDTWTTAGVAPARASGGAPGVPRPRPASPMGDDVGVAVIRWGEWQRYRDGDVFMFALDADAGRIAYGVNGQWMNGSPADGTGDTIGGAGASVVPFATLSASSQRTAGDRWHANFGRRPFRYAIPAGYSAYGTVPTLSAHAAGPGSTSIAGDAGGSPLGKTFQNEIVVGDQAIPLPEGRWTGLAFFRGRKDAGMGDSVVLGRVDDGRLVQMAAINAFRHAGTTRGGFPKFDACERTGSLHVDSNVNEAFGAQRCWWINHAVGVWREQPIFVAARSALDSSGTLAPEVMLNVGVRRADERGYVTVFYYFDPSLAGIDTAPTRWEDSAWERTRVTADPRRVEYVNELKAWGRSWASVVYAYRSDAAP